MYLGNGAATSCVPPGLVQNLTGVSAIRQGSDFLCAVREREAMPVWCWGSNFTAQFGTRTPTESRVPIATPIPMPNALVIGGASGFSIRSPGVVTAWGRNHWGQLGDGTVEPPGLMAGVAPHTVMLPGLLRLSLEGAQGQTACGVFTGGEVRCWGDGSAGQLGTAIMPIGPTTRSLVPVAIPGITDAVHVHVGGRFVCATRSDNTVWCWGYGNDPLMFGAGTRPLQVIDRAVQVSGGVWGGLCAAQRQHGVVLGRRLSRRQRRHRFCRRTGAGARRHRRDTHLHGRGHRLRAARRRRPVVLGQRRGQRNLRAVRRPGPHRVGGVMSCLHDALRQRVHRPAHRALSMKGTFEMFNPHALFFVVWLATLTSGCLPRSSSDCAEGDTRADGRSCQSSILITWSVNGIPDTPTSCPARSVVILRLSHPLWGDSAWTRVDSRPCATRAASGEESNTSRYQAAFTNLPTGRYFIHAELQSAAGDILDTKTEFLRLEVRNGVLQNTHWTAAFVTRCADGDPRPSCRPPAMDGGTPPDVITPTDVASIDRADAPLDDGPGTPLDAADVRDAGTDAPPAMDLPRDVAAAIDVEDVGTCTRPDAGARDAGAPSDRGPIGPCSRPGKTCPAPFTCTPQGTCASSSTGEVLVPAGEFWMGCNDANVPSVIDNCDRYEYPQHSVTLSRYAIDRTEVTITDWRRCVAAGASTPPPPHAWPGLREPPARSGTP